ncbi:hypothetical protein [Pseudomonas fragariae (ex Marin et al. 2024)]|uniref:hypothetical protein n=1 Tax=Pseudomonas fragariae (ex Marin et al. 2024) TaxID=3080056 RepID=UPI002A2452A0|nr:hypothetical protein [Pseudomonas sp. 20]MDX9625907.1 hypothetical protein [Pseudomonas sp. 20]
MSTDLMVPDFQKLPPLTEAQVVAGARPGETWAQARARLEASNYALPPIHYYDHPGPDYQNSGPFDECQGLDGGRINWQPGELG